MPILQHSQRSLTTPVLYFVAVPQEGTSLTFNRMQRFMRLSHEASPFARTLPGGGELARTATNAATADRPCEEAVRWPSDTLPPAAVGARARTARVTVSTGRGVSIAPCGAGGWNAGAA